MADQCASPLQTTTAPHLPRRLLHLALAGAQLAVRDVVPHGVVEEHQVLGNGAQAPPQARQAQVLDVVAAHPHRPALRIVEAVEQAEQRGLA